MFLFCTVSCLENQPQGLDTELWSSEKGGQWPEMAPWQLTWGPFSSLQWAYESGVKGPQVSDQALLLRTGLPSQPCMHTALAEALPWQGAPRARGQHFPYYRCYRHYYSSSYSFLTTRLVPGPITTVHTQHQPKAACQSCLKRKVRLRGGMLRVPHHRLPGVKLVSRPRLPGCVILDGPHLEIIPF